MKEQWQCLHPYLALFSERELQNTCKKLVSGFPKTTFPSPNSPLFDVVQKLDLSIVISRLFLVKFQVDSRGNYKTPVLKSDDISSIQDIYGESNFFTHAARRSAESTIWCEKRYILQVLERLLANLVAVARHSEVVVEEEVSMVNIVLECFYQVYSVLHSLSLFLAKHLIFSNNIAFY